MENLNLFKNISLLVILIIGIIVLFKKGYSYLQSGENGLGLLLIVIALLVLIGCFAIIGTLYILIKQTGPKQED